MMWSNITAAFSGWFSRGTELFDAPSQPRVLVVNVLATIVPALAFVYATVLFFLGPQNFIFPISLIIFVTPVLLLTPFLWPRGVVFATLFNLTTWTIFHLLFCYVMGRESGAHMLFLTGSVVSLVIMGVRLNVISVISASNGIICYVIAELLFIENQLGFDYSPAQKNILQLTSSALFMLCVAGIIGYAFYLLRLAETKLEQEYEYSENLLNALMPKPIADRLKLRPKQTIAKQSKDVSILFADIAGFTAYTAEHSPQETVKMLNELFVRFDKIIADRKFEKIKTIGDSYMVAGNLTVPSPNHVQDMAELASDLRRAAQDIMAQRQTPLELRIGFHVGPVVAGVIGSDKPFFDVWGSTVNIAARLENEAGSGKILVSEAVKDRVGDACQLKPVKTLDLKGLGPTKTYEMICDK